MKKFKNIFLGIMISVILTIMFVIIFSAILVNTNISENYIDITVMIISGVSILIGSSIATKKIKKNGAVMGVATAMIYLISIYIISSIFLGNFSVSSKSLIMIMIGTILGCVGGILGVNLL